MRPASKLFLRKLAGDLKRGSDPTAAPNIDTVFRAIIKISLQLKTDEIMTGFRLIIIITINE